MVLCNKMSSSLVILVSPKYPADIPSSMSLMTKGIGSVKPLIGRIEVGDVWQRANTQF